MRRNHLFWIQQVKIDLRMVNFTSKTFYIVRPQWTDFLAPYNNVDIVIRVYATRIVYTPYSQLRRIHRAGFQQRSDKRKLKKDSCGSSYRRRESSLSIKPLCSTIDPNLPVLGVSNVPLPPSFRFVAETANFWLPNEKSYLSEDRVQLMAN